MMMQERGADLERYPRVDERGEDLIWSFLSFLNFIVHKTHLENQLKHRLPDLTSEILIQWAGVGLQNLHFFFYHLLVDTDAASQD